MGHKRPGVMASANSLSRSAICVGKATLSLSLPAVQAHGGAVGQKKGAPSCGAPIPVSALFADSCAVCFRCGARALRSPPHGSNRPHKICRYRCEVSLGQITRLSARLPTRRKGSKSRVDGSRYETSRADARTRRPSLSPSSTALPYCFGRGAGAGKPLGSRNSFSSCIL